MKLTSPYQKVSTATPSANREVADFSYAKSISIKEARKLLGSSARTLSDDQVQVIITTLTLMARQHFRNSGSKNGLGI